jgi:hypothetical protein
LSGKVAGGGIEAEPTIGGLTALARYLFAGGLAGLIAGIVVLGAGSRIVMRVSFLLDPEAEGSITENGNVIGEVTAGGSVGLLIFVGAFGGLLAGLLWVIVRDWLPGERRMRIALAGAVSGLLGSFMVVSAENRDFLILRPAEANIAMFVAIVGLTGSATAALDLKLQRVLPSSRRSAFLFGALTLAGGALALPIALQAFLSEDFCGCEAPPRAAAAFLVLSGVASLVAWSRSLRPGGATDFHAARLRLAGITGVAGACFVAAIDLVSEIDKIL